MSTSQHFRTRSPGAGWRQAELPPLGLLLLASMALLDLTAIGLLIGFAVVPAWEADLTAQLEVLTALLPFRLGAAETLATLLSKATLLVVAIMPVMLLEAALAGWRNCSLHRLLAGRSVSSVYDALLFLLNFAGLWRYIVTLATLGGAVVAGVLLAQVAAQVAAQGLKLHSGSVALDCVLAFILFTFTDYWSHRLFHGRTFWPLHRMHHSATEMTALTLWRNHPTAPVLEVFFKVWPLMLFDAPAAVVAGVGLGVQVYQHLVHSNIAWHWGWFGRWVLQPPAAHRLHHAMDPVLHDRNLGIPVVWDRLFGTWADPRQAGPHLAIGVADSATNTGRLHLEAWQDLKDCAWQVRQVLAAGWHRSRAAFAPGTASGKAPPPPPG